MLHPSTKMQHHKLQGWVLQVLEETPGFEAFESRRQKKVTKQMAGGAIQSPRRRRRPESGLTKSEWEFYSTPWQFQTLSWAALCTKICLCTFDVQRNIYIYIRVFSYLPHLRISSVRLDHEQQYWIGELPLVEKRILSNSTNYLQISKAQA